MLLITEKKKAAQEKASQGIELDMRDSGAVVRVDALEAWDLALSKLPIKDDCEEAWA